MRIAVTFLILLPLASIAFGGWNEPMQLTPNHVYSTSIAANGSNIHIMSSNWPDGRILYFRSTDYGRTWGTIPQFADTVRDSGYPPRLTIRDSVVCAVWEGSISLNLGISSNNGQSWRFKSNILRLEYDDLMGYCPGLIEYRPYFLCNRMLPYEDGMVINFNIENLGDTTWPTPLEIIPTNMAGDIKTVYYDNVIHALFWGSPNDQSNSIQPYYFRSTDYGQTWSNLFNLRYGSVMEAWFPKLAVNESGGIAACYMDTRSAPLYSLTGNISLRISHDNGLTWDNEIQLSDSNRVSEPALSWSHNTIAVAYLAKPQRTYPLISISA